MRAILNKIRGFFRHYIIAVLCISSSFSYVVGQVQNSGNKIPELNSHIFLPSTMIEDPFNNTYMDIGVGIAASGEFKYPLFEIGGDPINATRGQLMYVDVGLKYQQKIQDWASMHIKYFLVARLGTNVGTILAQGFSTINAFQIGWKIKLAERDRYRLSTTFGVSNYNGTFLSVTKFVEDIINNQPYPSLVTNVPSLTGDLGIHFAYGISSLFGLKLSYVNSIGESLERGKSTYLYSFGAVADVNFYQKYRLPLGLSFTYHVSNHPEQVFREGSISNGFNIKLAYTGTDDLVIGLNASYTFIPVADIEDNFKLAGFAFSLRYYFN